MTLSNDAIETFYFRFLNDEISLSDFEQWIYATPELENYLGESAYFELISFNFRQPAVKHEISKVIDAYGIPIHFYQWQLKRNLQSLLDDTLDPVDVFERLYDMSCNQYFFLYDIGIQYVLGIDEIPKRVAEDLWDPEEYKRRRAPLGDYIDFLKQEIEILLDALEAGELRIINQSEYQIDSTTEQKLRSIHLIRAHQAKQAALKVQKKG